MDTAELDMHEDQSLKHLFLKLSSPRSAANLTSSHTAHKRSSWALTYMETLFVSS